MNGDDGEHQGVGGARFPDRSASAHGPTPPSGPLTCRSCGDVIGAYEPLVLVSDGASWETSRAAEPTVHRAVGEHYHRDCFLRRQASL